VDLLHGEEESAGESDGVERREMRAEILTGARRTDLDPYGAGLTERRSSGDTLSDHDGTSIRSILDPGHVATRTSIRASASVAGRASARSRVVSHPPARVHTIDEDPGNSTVTR
jgi:hypothetical protein